MRAGREVWASMAVFTGWRGWSALKAGLPLVAPVVPLHGDVAGGVAAHDAATRGAADGALEALSQETTSVLARLVPLALEQVSTICIRPLCTATTLARIVR